MNGLLEAILTEIIIPEIASILRNKPNATDAEVISEWLARRQRIIKTGRTFLAATDSEERTD